MKRILVITAVIMMILAGCGEAEPKKSSEQPKTEESKNQLVTVSITKDNGKEKMTTKKIELKDGATVMDVMKNNYKIETQYDGAFISSIDGVTANEKDKTSWFLSVNDKEAMKGAKEIKLKAGDKVNFDFHKYE